MHALTQNNLHFDEGWNGVDDGIRRGRQSSSALLSPTGTNRTVCSLVCAIMSRWVIRDLDGANSTHRNVRFTPNSDQGLTAMQNVAMG